MTGAAVLTIIALPIRRDPASVSDLCREKSVEITWDSIAASRKDARALISLLVDRWHRDPVICDERTTAIPPSWKGMFNASTDGTWKWKY